MESWRESLARNGRILQITHDAVITSLLRYGLVVVGSCLLPYVVSRIDACIVNVAARRITGLDGTVRLESLHFLASTSSYQNLYMLHCAEFADAVLRAEGSSAKKRLEQEIGVILRTQGERIETQEEFLQLPAELE